MYTNYKFSNVKLYLADEEWGKTTENERNSWDSGYNDPDFALFSS